MRDGLARLRMRSEIGTFGLRPYVADFTDDGISDVLLYDPKSGLAVKAVNTGLGSFAMGNHTWDKGLAIIAGKPYP